MSTVPGFFLRKRRTSPFALSLSKRKPRQHWASTSSARTVWHLITASLTASRHTLTNLLVSCAWLVPALGHAALADLADLPLGSASSSAVKPNILFVLDDSGSMGWSYMPDDVESSEVGYRNHLCNTIYYNPSVTYVVPTDSVGTPLHNSSPATFAAACSNGYSASSCGTNLGTQRYWQYLGGDAALAWPSSGSNDCTLGDSIDIDSKSGVCSNGSSLSASTYPTPTDASCVSAYGSGKTLVWKRVSLTSASADAQNYANWYSYYRTRMMMMQAAAGRAFLDIPDSYRVGFLTINPGSPVSSGKFLPIADFDATQKSNWYSKLYSQTGNNNTPLREALSRAGRYFAHKTDGINSGMSDDPVQYSCQQNFTILTTDGYWNSNSGVQLDGSSALDNQDGNVAELDAYNPSDKKLAVSPPPIYDGTSTYYAYHELRKVYRSTNSGCSGGKRKRQYRYDDYRTYYSGPGKTGSIIGTPSSTATTSYIDDSACSSTAAVYALPTPNPQILAGTAPAEASSLTVCATWPCEIVTSSGGSSNSLADVAQYYYKTDLRNSTLSNCSGALGGSVNVCDNNVPSTGAAPTDDNANWQHMTTFTLGMGLAGTLNYSPTYKSDPSGDYADISAGTLSWPTPSSGSSTTLDDLWHAAVNGRGQFFSAKDPDSVVTSLSAALAGISKRVGSGAAAATSNLEPVPGDNFVYVASFVTQDWTGELAARALDLTTGTVSGTAIWSAQTELDKLGKSACDTRAIKLFRAGAANNMVNFTWNTQTCDVSGNPTGAASTELNAAEQAHFSGDEVANLSQSPHLTAAQSGAAEGSNLVNFLRGQRGKEGFSEGDTSLDALYRVRAHIFGDIISAQPAFVRLPQFEYDDAGYAAFKSGMSARGGTVYAAANDGMLHAFNADTGEERWAFIPTMVLPNLHKLASSNYANQHIFLTDGTPTIGDVFDSAASSDCGLSTPASPQACWKTVLVAGLNKGGKGYYALDITDPAAPKALWEFKYSGTCYDAANSATWGADCHLGYSYGNPVISKLGGTGTYAGRWVVLVTSGYNNVNSPVLAGDGQGYLYVLDAITGKILYKIGTGAGTAATPSGLAHISGWVNVDSSRNNTTDRVYGADLGGNVWRFDINDSYGAGGREASLLVQLVDPGGTPQPITTRPRLGEVNGYTYVYVGTGRYLGTTDLSDTQTQAVWGIKDVLAATPVANPRSSFSRWQITNIGSGSTAYRTSACIANCDSTLGWINDLPDSGERINIDMYQLLGMVIAVSNVPASNACNIGGYSWINFFDSATGGPLSSSAGLKVGNKVVSADGTESTSVGISIVVLPGGKAMVLVTTKEGNLISEETPPAPGAPQGRRVSWREIAE